MTKRVLGKIITQKNIGAYGFIMLYDFPWLNTHITKIFVLWIILLTTVSRIKAVFRTFTPLGIGCFHAISFPPQSHNYSTWFRSGDFAGHGFFSMASLWRYSWTRLPRWGRALSAINKKSDPFAHLKCLTKDFKTSSWYLWPATDPLSKTCTGHRSLFLPIPSHLHY